MSNRNNIENSIKRELKNNIIDLSIDYAELTLDSILENDAIKELPVVKSIVGVIKGGLKVREAFFAKKILTFFREFHKGNINESKRIAFCDKIENDEKYRNKVIEQIVILNERFLEIEKSKILANLLLAHINGKYKWEVFKDLTICLNNLHLKGLLILEESAKNKEKPFYMKIDLSRPDEGLLASAGLVKYWGEQYFINAYGQNLYFYGVKGDFDFCFPANTGN